jgi:hypothetical protein
MQSVAGYRPGGRARHRILARNPGAPWARSGYSCLQVADAMTQRLALDTFNVAQLGEEDRRKWEELREFLRELAIVGDS